MKTSKRNFWFLVLLVVGLLVVLAACGDDEEDKSDSEEEQSTTTVFRVAVVAPSAIDDLAFSQSMHQALLVVQEELGAENFQFDFQAETFVVDDAEIAMRAWAESGAYDLIIAHGSQFGAIVEALATEFPQISFAWGTDLNTFDLANVFAYEAASEQGGYVNGVLAASLTQSDTIGVIGPIEVGDAKRYVDGFVAGVNATNPDAEVTVSYIGSFSDVPRASQIAETYVENAVDVMTGTAQMVVGPIDIAKENGNILWLGTQSNQAEVAGEAGVAFQVYHWERILFPMIDLIKAGTLGGTSYSLSLENEGLVIEFSDSFELTDELETLAEETIQGIISGDIEITLEE